MCTPVCVCMPSRPAGILSCLKCVCVSVLVLSFVHESVGTTTMCVWFGNLTWTVSKQFRLFDETSIINFLFLSADLFWAVVWADV